MELLLCRPDGAINITLLLTSRSYGAINMSPRWGYVEFVTIGFYAP